MALRLGIDAWNLLHDRRGIGRYTRAILRRWARWDRTLLLPYLIVPQRMTWFAARRYREEAALPDARVAHRGAVAALGIQAVWYPWNGMSWLSPAVNIATLHDASVFSVAPPDRALAEKEQRPFRLAAQQAARIITDSHFAKSDLVRHLKLDPYSVDVIYLGVDESFTRSQPPSGHVNAPGAPNQLRYFLFVGEPEARKGVDVLLQAAATLPQELKDSIEIVLAGHSGKYRLPSVPAGVRVRSVGYVNDAELAQLYGGAAALVQPSRYEGFGLPILEAMAAGTPVIASDIPSLRESAGEAAEFFPTGDSLALASAMTRVLQDGGLAVRLRNRGMAQASSRTWDLTARQTFDSIERAVHESAG